MAPDSLVDRLSSAISLSAAPRMPLRGDGEGRMLGPDSGHRAMSESVETFQLSLAAAEAYQAEMVPALFSQWAARIVESAGVRPGWAVLDVACGTGVVARAARDAVGPEGLVTGVDLNEGMLAVAGRCEAGVDWCLADAADLPFADGVFNAVLCQSALMFFPDPAAALAEMARVVAPGGMVAVQVWASLDDQPAYGPLVAAAARHAGPEANTLLGTYWKHGDRGRTVAAIADTGLTVVGARTYRGVARFASIEAMVRVEMEATPLLERLDDAAYRRIVGDCRRELSAFEADGEARVPIVGHIISARRWPVVAGSQGPGGAAG